MSSLDSHRISKRRSWIALALALGATGAGVVPARAAKGDPDAKEQLRFGVDMARRGLWNEALFRFEQVRKLAPSDPKALNNLAVAYEAVGRFDEADATYLEALRVAPGNREIKRNATRFREFLQKFGGNRRNHQTSSWFDGTPTRRSCP